MASLPQDTNTNLCIIDDEGNTRKGLLKMQHNNGNVSLSFFPEIVTDNSKGKSQGKRIAQIAECVYQLSDFTMIEMDRDDDLIVTLSGSRSRCQLYFNRNNDISHFLQYIESKVRLKKSDCNPRVYLLEPPDVEQKPITPYRNTALPETQQHGKAGASRVSLQRIQHPGLTFKTDIPVPKLTSDEYYALFDSEGRIVNNSQFPSVFYNKDIDLKVMGDLWKLLLDQDDVDGSNQTEEKTAAERNAEKTSEQRKEKLVRNCQTYKKIKEQWKRTTPRQWKNYPELRKLVELLETDIDDHQALFDHFPEPDCVKRIAFNILLTLSYWNWDKAIYVKDLVTFLAPFLDSFIESANCEKVIFHDETEMDIEDAEGEIFWCFNSFYEHNQLCDLVRPSDRPIQRPLFIAVGCILEDSFPELLQLLKQKHAYTLDFLGEDCAKWFTTCFSGPDVRRLWISILSFKSSFQFFQCFIVSLLFSLAPHFVEMNPLNTDEFVRRFHNLKTTKVDLNLLLQNASGVMNILRKKSNS